MSATIRKRPSNLVVLLRGTCAVGLAAFALSACSQGGDGGGIHAKGPGVVPSGDALPAVPGEDDQVKGTDDMAAAEKRAAAAEAKKKPGKRTGGGGESNLVPEASSANEPTEGAPASAAQRDRVPVILRIDVPGYDPQNQPFFADASGERGVRVTTYRGPSGAPQYISAAGRDNLYARLTDKIKEFEGAEAFAANRKFAESIGITDFVVDPSTRRFSLAVRLRDGTGTYLFNGSLADGRRSAQAVEATQIQDARAWIQCLDADGECTVALIKVSRTTNGGERPQRQLAYLISRHSPVVPRLSPPFRIEENPAYNELMGLYSTPSADLRLWLDTTETVGGGADFIVGMRARVSEPGCEPSRPIALGFEGLLLKEPTSSLAYRNLRSGHKLAAWLTPARSDSWLATSIAAARLVRNDGRGTIQLQFDVGAPGARMNVAVISYASVQKALKRDVQL